MLVIKPELSVSEIEARLLAELSVLPIEGLPHFKICPAQRDRFGANWDVEVLDNGAPRGFKAGLACVLPDLRKRYDVDWQSP